MCHEPFQTYNRYLRRKFGQRVQRIPIHAGFTCPNRDGTVGTGGCIYCDNSTFNPFVTSDVSVTEQVRAGMERARARYRAGLFLAYFQTFTGTYGPVEELRRMYDSVLSVPGICGLIVGTRPDCLPEPVLDLLTELARRVPVWVELGVQSANDRSLVQIRRGHTWNASEQAIRALTERDIPVAAHVILGLPGETMPEMLHTARSLNMPGVQGLKLHHLYAVTGTALAEMYHAGDWRPMEPDEYIETAARFIACFPPAIVVMRFAGECPASMLVAPVWSMGKRAIQEAVTRRVTELRAGEIQANPE